MDSRVSANKAADSETQRLDIVKVNAIVRFELMFVPIVRFLAKNASARIRGLSGPEDTGVLVYDGFEGFQSDGSLDSHPKLGNRARAVCSSRR